MKFCFTSCAVCVQSSNQYFPRGGQPIKSNSATAHHISLIANMTGRPTTTLRHAEPSLTQAPSISCRTFTQIPSTHIRRQMQYNTRLPSQSKRMPLFWTLFFPTGPWRHRIAIHRNRKNNQPVIYMYKLAKWKSERLENVNIGIRWQDDEIH